MKQDTARVSIRIETQGFLRWRHCLGIISVYIPRVRFAVGIRRGQAIRMPLAERDRQIRVCRAQGLGVSGVAAALT